MDAHSEEDPIGSLPGIELPYTKSKDEVWNQLSSKIDFEKAHISKTTNISIFKYAVAASILLLIGAMGYLRFSTTTISCPKGEHLSHFLPDSSHVDLNAGTTIKYNPHWWRFSRKLQFNGEAFFSITKGRKLEIISNYGKTTVLGTSFNIYARAKDYQVTCFTGKVKVVSKLTSDGIILLPKDQATLTRNGQILLKKDINPEEKIMWRSNLFFFTATPLEKVFQEIELQYDIKIVEKGKYDLLFTGNFKKEESVEQVLNLVCLPFGLKFVKGPFNNYIITPNSPE